MTASALDGNTCDRDWFKVEIDYRKTYKLQLESEADLLIDGVYNYRGYLLPERRHDLHIARKTEGALHLDSRHGPLQRRSWLHRQLHPESDRGVAPLGPPVPPVPEARPLVRSIVSDRGK